MAPSKIVFISDVHMGIDAATNWYQSEAHQRFLLCALDYVIENAADIDELVLLGDLVDLWMYKPDITPPSFMEVAEAQPAIFGTQSQPGKLLEVLDALKGRVRYLHGNHDITVRPEEVAQLKSPGGYSLLLDEGTFYLPEIGEGQLFATHGHAFSLFCAPNFESGLKAYPGLPFGYFIARLFGRWCTQHVTPDKPNAAYFEKDGNPNGFDFDLDLGEGVLQALLKGKPAIAEMLMNGISDATGHADNEFVMMDGGRVALKDVGDYFHEMYLKYPGSSKLERKYYGFSWWARTAAFLETDGLATLHHFVKRLTKYYPMIVMGHTHKPMEEAVSRYFGLCGRSLYANSGFNCPPIPCLDDESKFPTFVEVDVDRNQRRFTARVNKIQKEGDGLKVVAFREDETIKFRKP